MDVSEQIEKFKDFIEVHYGEELHDLVQKGEKSLILDFSLLSEHDVELAEALLKEPEEIVKAAEMALEQFDLPEESTLDRVRFKNLPESQNIMIGEIRSRHLGEFLSVEGIVRQASDIRPQVTCAKFECQGCGNTISILQLDSKFKEPSRCTCGMRGRFRQVSQDLVDAQHVKIEEPPEMLEGGAQPKRLSIFLKEDLVDPRMEKKCTPGSKVRVVGIVKEVPVLLKTGAKSVRYDIILEANNIESVQEEYSDLVLTREDIDEIEAFAKSPDVYDKFTKSIAPSIWGHDKIKGALVLQLLGGARKEKSDGTVMRGDIHILLCGDPGSGKCLDGDTKIVLEDGSIVTIADFVDKNSLKAIDGGFEGNYFKLPSLNLDGQFFISGSNIVWKRKNFDTLIKIKTQSGNELIVTKNHPLFTTQNGIIYSIPAESLSLGTYIATPRYYNVKSSIQRFEDNFERSNARNKVSLNVPQYLDEKCARFLAYLLGEGWARLNEQSGMLTFTNNNSFLINDFINVLNELGVNYTLGEAHNGKSCKEVYSCSIELVRFIQLIEPSLLMRAKFKKIPRIIQRSPNNILKEFIIALFDSEGHVNKNKREIELTSASKDLIVDLKILLLRFGILSRISEVYKCATNTRLKIKRPYYTLRISGFEIKKYYEFIGFNIDAKQNDLEKLVFVNKVYNTNVDVLPGLSSLLLELRNDYNFSQFSFNIPQSSYQHYERGDRLPSREQLLKILMSYPDYESRKKVLNKFATSDIFWDKIVYLEEIDSTNGFVYDIQVNETHNYIANSIVVHNSQLLQFISKTAPKARFVSGKGASGAGITASVVKDEFLKGWCLEAGALVLANNGLAVVDELDKMSPEDRSALHEALEQQSYHSDFKIIFADGTVSQIGSFVDKLMDENAKDVVKGKDCEILSISNYKVLTTDFKRIYPISIDRVSRHKAPDYFFEVKFSNGRKIMVTPEHPFFVFKNGIYQEISVSQLEVGFLIPAPRILPFETKQNLLKNVVLNALDKEINLPQTINLDFARFLGYFVSEGHSYLNRSNYYAEVGISNTNPLICDDVVKLFDAVFKTRINTHVALASSRQKANLDLKTLRCCSLPMYNYLKQNFDGLMFKAPFKYVPNNIRSLNIDSKIEFLKAAFRGDGFVDSERFGYSTASYELAKGYSDLLLEFGCWNYIAEERRFDACYYKVIISGSEGMNLFLKNVVEKEDSRYNKIFNFCQRSKLKMNDRDILPLDMVKVVNNLLKELHLSDGHLFSNINRGQNAHVGTIRSYLSKLEDHLEIKDTKIRNLRRRLNISVLELANQLNCSCATIYNFEKRNDRDYINLVNNLAKKKLNKLKLQIFKIRELVDSDLRFVTVKSIKKVKNKTEKWVYDVTVEPNHTFISEGLVLHNTVTISKANIQATLRARATLLAAANPKFGRFDPFTPLAGQIDLPPSLINRFDLIFPIRDIPDKIRDEAIASHVLESTVADTSYATEVSPEFLRKYIAYVRQKINPTMTKGAINEIKNFYVTLRNSGSSSSDAVKPIPISARQLEALIRLSEASAKVRLDTQVKREDAQRAIELLRHCLMQVGFDPETGQIDIDRISSGITAAVRNKIMAIKEIISDLEAKGLKEIPIEEVIAEAAKKGIEESKVEESIEKLKRSGDIFEPKRGFLSRI